jgi:hypothetical protein
MAFVAHDDVEGMVAQAVAQERVLAAATGGVAVKPEHGPMPKTGTKTKYCAEHGWNTSHTDPACRRHKNKEQGKKKEWKKGGKGGNKVEDKKVAFTAEVVTPAASDRMDKLEKMMESMQAMMMQQRMTPMTPYGYAPMEQTPAPYYQVGGGNPTPAHSAADTSSKHLGSTSSTTKFVHGSAHPRDAAARPSSTRAIVIFAEGSS